MTSVLPRWTSEQALRGLRWTIQLTPAQMRLFDALAQRSPDIVDRATLCAVAGTTSRGLYQLVYGLRKKLGPDWRIVTEENGSGYALRRPWRV